MGAWLRRALAGVVGFVMLAGLACAGPRVDVSSVAVHAPAGGLVRVQARLLNRGGAGAVKVAVRLRDRASGRTFVGARHLDLAARDTVDAVVDVPAPAGAYEAAVAVVFPPD